MGLLEKVNSPKDIKSFSTKQLEELCAEIREYMITCCAQNPGHVGASLGAVELAVALHYVFDTPEDRIVWDVGHQAYAHKIITGRRDLFTENRKKGGLSGFPKRAESPYDAFGTGHSSTSISAALGMAVADKYLDKKRKIVAIIGDGAMSGGLAFEGLNNAGAMKTDILVILNDNQISIDPNIGALHNYLLKISTSRTYNHLKNSVWEAIGARTIRKHIQKFMFSTKMALLKNGSLFESLGFRYFGEIDGNDIQQLIITLSNLKQIQGPKLLHISTKKGKGYKPAEENQVVWHAPGKFDISTGDIIKPKIASKDKYQVVFGETLLDLAKVNDKIVGITPAMPSGSSMNILMSKMPNRGFDVGIAEQHAVTFSAGLAAEGLIPFCAIYSSFMQRAYDNIIHDVALQNLKVVFCLDRSGIVGEDGATHHGAYDLSYLRPIPNLTIMAPLNEIELRNMMYSATLPEYGTCTIRYPRGSAEGIEWRNEKFQGIERGKAQKLRDGDKLAILSIGSIGNKVSKAIDLYKEEANEKLPLHYDMRFLKPLDLSAIDEAANKADTIITVEDGTTIGGLHGAVAEYIAEKGYKCKVIGLGIPDKFIEQGTVEELITDCGYNVQDILKEIKENIQ